MNGSRSNTPRPGERSSLDALNRTIEGLEARIDGLLGGASRDGNTRLQERPQQRVQERPQERFVEAAPRLDPISEIFERQRALEARRERGSERLDRRMSEDRPPATRREQPLPFTTRAEPVRTEIPARAVPSAALPIAEMHNAVANAAMPNTAMKDIAQALVGLRQELKQDISEGLSREMTSLRAEIRGIKSEAPMESLADDMRDDMQRLAESINQLGRQASPAETQALRRDFEELRLMIDGLAREDSVQKMDTRWGAVEDRLSGFDGKGMHSEINAIAFRLDDIKSQLGGMSASPMVHALEDKIVTMAQAVEMLGRHMEPDNKRMVSQFSAIDERLDEISRAIVASGRTSAAAQDNTLVNRLESRIAGLAEQIELLAQPAEAGLGQRIEALAARMEEFANEETAARLEERLGQLSTLLERSQKSAQQPDFTGYLTDISRKIDALDQGSVNDVLAERLDQLSRRIEDLNIQPPSRANDDRFSRLEDRLVDIAQRLEDAQTAPLDDHDAMRGLEAQIANLSTLISSPRSNMLSAPGGMSDEMEQRMGALEDYMATSDEYIIEAARQAAEAVMEAYGRNGQTAMSAGGASDMAALSALADDLRTLEEISRSSDERTARTFEALHETLVQIAGRLERLDIRGDDLPARAESRPVMPRASLPALNDDEDLFAGVDPWTDHDDLRQEAHALQGTELPPTRQPNRQPDDMIAAAVQTVREEAASSAAAEQLPTARGGLLAGLVKRLPGSRRDEQQPATHSRQHVDPTPSIDASAMIAPEEANQLLEPGSGAPDVKKILERVRAGQIGKDAGNRAPASETEKADFITAARRAAQMAADEADTLNKNAPRERLATSGAPASSGVRRPIMMAVGAVLLAIMSYPLVSAFIGGDEAPVQPPVAAIEENAAQETHQATIGQTTSEQGLTVGQPAGETVAKDRGREPLAADQAAADTMAAQTGQTPEQPQDLQPLPADETIDKAPMLTPEATTDGAQTKLETLKAGTAQAGEAANAMPVPAEITTASLVTAVKSGDPLALFEIGARYTEGRGVKTDLAAAAKWYQSSADTGFAPAQYRLANLYEKGTGVERDMAKAKEYYLLAADQGNASAMHNLAVLFATGGGGNPDYAAASGWFQKAADLGIRDSQFNLAILFARGNGVKQDLEESYKWFAIAARDGDKDAAQKRDEVANAMRPEQLESAKAKFDLWKPKPLDTKANTAIVPDDWAGKGTNTASIDVGKAIRNIQAILNNNGFDAGKPDGQMGAKTVAAIKKFQTSVGQKATGEIDDALVRELLKRNKA